MRARRNTRCGIPLTRPAWCAAVIALLVAATGAAPQDPAPVDPPTFRAGVEAVRVDVIVNGKDGRPVEGLTRDDFQLTEDGKPQVIEQFETIRIDAEPDAVPMAIRSTLDEELEAQRDDVRLFVIYSARSYIGREAAERVLDPLVRFVESLPPGDMLAVVDDWTPPRAMMLTRDRDEIVRAILRLTDEEVRDRRNRMLLNGDLLENPGAPDPIRGLEAVSNRLSHLRNNRQTIIYIGSGIWSRGGNRELDLSLLIGTLNRNNTAVYVLDPTGLQPGASIARTYDLRALAEDTGGRAIVNTNDVERGLRDVAADASSYYLLGYTSPAGADGRVHKIRVSVSRKDVTVRARSGFRALTPSQITASAARSPDVPPAVQTAMGRIAASVATSQYIHTWVGVDRNAAGHPQVTLAWEPAGARAGQERVTRVAVEATTPDGGELFTGSSPDAGAAAPDGRGPHRIAFDAPPGVVTLRLSVESAGGLLDTESRAVRVFDPAAPDAPALSTPRVFAARTVPQLRAALADGDFPPTAHREFARTDRLLVRFTAYSPQAQPRAALLNRLGQRMFDLPVTPTATGGTHQIETGLSSVPPGEYLIEIRAGADNTSGVELVAFRVR